MGQRIASFSLTLLLLLLSACERKAAPGAPGPGAGAPAPAPLRVAVVPKGTTHDFWKSIHAGAEKAAREIGGVQVTFRGPEREDDREQQVSLVQNLIGAGYDAIVLAPLDDRALVEPVRQASAAGVPVVIIDSGLAGEVGRDFVSYIATDNYKGGFMAGEHLAGLVGGTGSVLMLRYQEGSASTTQREQGFLDAMAKATGVTVIDPRRYAGATRATAQEAAENLLTVHEGLAGIFCPNESSTFGMLLALRGRSLAGKVKFVGFDASEGLVEALRAGEIDALTVQNPMRMGYLGVKTAVEHIRGLAVEPQIDTGVALVTRDTMDTPEHHELLAPDLATYLGGP